MILQGEEKILTGNWKTLGNTGNFVIWIYADTTKICTIFLENLKSYLNKHESAHALTRTRMNHWHTIALFS